MEEGLAQPWWFSRAPTLLRNARKKYNKKEIGPDGRYVELYDCFDQFMKKICNLPYE